MAFKPTKWVRRARLETAQHILDAVRHSLVAFTSELAKDAEWLLYWRRGTRSERIALI